MMLGNWSISVGNPWWLILIPLVLPPLVWIELPQPGRAGAGAAGAGDPVPDGGHHADRAGPGRAAVGSADRPADDDVPGRRLATACPAKQQKAGARLRDRGVEETAAGTTWPGVVVFGKEPRVEVPPAPSELNLLGIESTIDPENTDLGAAVKLALATLSRGHRAADRHALRRQREPGQPARAGADRQVAGRAGRRPADRLPLRPRGPGREGLDSSRRQEGRDGQHQRRDPRQRADQRDAPDLPEGRQLPGARPRATSSRCRSSSSAASTSSRSSSSSPSRTSTRSPPSSSPTRTAATAGRSTTSPRGSPTPGARPRSS